MTAVIVSVFALVLSLVALAVSISNLRHTLRINQRWRSGAPKSKQPPVDLREKYGAETR